MEKVDPDLVEKVCNKVDSVLNQNINVSKRIKFPLVWARLPNGIRVQDLQEDRYNECLDHIKNVYMADEPLCASLGLLEDEESVQKYLKLIHSRMKDTQSVVAVKEDENRVIGCLIERVVDSEIVKTMSRMSIYDGSNLCKIQRLRKHILKSVNFYDIFGTYRCNDIYIWCVEEQFRCQGIGTALLQAAIRQTELFKCSILCGIFTSEHAQSIARQVGFEPVFEVQYATWVEGQEVVFENPGASNYAASFMVIYFEPVDFFPEEEEAVDEEEEEEEGEDEEEEIEEAQAQAQAMPQVTTKQSTSKKKSEDKKSKEK